MGLFKKIAQKFVEDRWEKKIEKSDLPPELKQQALQQGKVAADMVSTNFENNVKSSGKAAVAFITGMTAGPAAAFTAATSVAAVEAAKNQQMFIDDALARGLKVTVDGEQISALTPPTIEENKNLVNTSALLIAGTGTLIVGGILYWMFE